MPKKDISKKNLQKKYNKMQDGLNELTKKNRVKRVDGYFGEG